jgi:hypothetical protein
MAEISHPRRSNFFGPSEFQSSRDRGGAVLKGAESHEAGPDPVTRIVGEEGICDT